MSMKRSYRVMQIFQIQRDYKKHKERLMSIDHISPKNRLNRSSSKNQQTVNNYKKHHFNAESFAWDNANKKLEYENNLLLKNIEKVNTRESSMLTTLRRSNSHSGSSHSKFRKTSSTSLRNSQINEENKIIQKKIQKTKSNYEVIRKNKSNSLFENSHRQKQHSELELKRLLENQFRIKPNVLFPQVKKKRSGASSSRASQKFVDGNSKRDIEFKNNLTIRGGSKSSHSLIEKDMTARLRKRMMAN